MRNRISAIIIDSEKDKHDYSDIEFYGCDFELFVYEDDTNIISKINENRGIDAIITIGVGNAYAELNKLPFEYRKMWSHIDTFDRDNLINLIVSNMAYNLDRIDSNNPLFSFFTCAFNTPKSYVDRLYNSILKQTYNNWNWWILDDGNDGKESYFAKIDDPRVHVIKNISDHGNIGFNKHLIASICDGDYLVEVDHDDEITSDCLALLKKCFDTYTDCDFAYSYAYEEIGGSSVRYDDGFELGLGKYEWIKIENNTIYTPITPDISALSIRHIITMPNHVRCWKRDFYHSIGGHNIQLSVLDDMDIIIRTFLKGKMCKIPKILYIQHEGDYNGGRENGSTTQSNRFKEIQRSALLLKYKYDKQIHERLLSIGIDDPYWVEGENYSDIFSGVKNGTKKINYTLDI